MPAVCGPTTARSASMSMSPFGERRNLLHRAAAHRRRRGIGAVRRVGNDDLGAGMVVARLVIGADHRDARELALRAGHRRERDALHAGDFLQHLLQLVQALQDPLPGRVRRERMAPEELRQHRVLVAGPRVVFHRARPERVEVRVDGEIELREAREVTHRLQFGNLGQPRRRAPAQRLGQRGHRAAGRVLRRGAATRRGVLENQLFAHRILQRLRPRPRSS